MYLYKNMLGHDLREISTDPTPIFVPARRILIEEPYSRAYLSRYVREAHEMSFDPTICGLG